jgi:hypothetical protein
MTRAGLRPISRQTRAYFAAVDRVNGPTAIFDPSKDSGFQLDAPPAPWIDLGWIENFQRTSTSQIEALIGGVVGAVSAQARHALGARVEFEFRDWGKLQMAVAGGAEHMNVLATDPSASRAGSGGIPVSSVPLLPGSTATQLVLGVGVVAGFHTGDLVACDVDYTQQTGYVGTGIAASYVKNPADVRGDANYIRRVTFNVGRVAGVTATSLLLTQALPGGIAAGASVQKVIAFVDREGGSFLQQWSGLFVAEEESGGRVCYFYPILSPCTVKPEWSREKVFEIQKPISELALQASFAALPTVDGNDGATVLSYRSYFPASGAAVY